MQCTGTVVESEGENARVLIESNACDGCHACGFGALRDRKSMVVNALNKVGASKDDRVHLEVSGRKVMSASAILFLLPFCGFIAGFLLGYLAVGPVFHIDKTLTAVVLAFLFLGASYYPVHVFGNRSEFEFVILSVAARELPRKPGP